MLSYPVLKVLDRTTKVLVDREEKGLGMDMEKYGRYAGQPNPTAPPPDPPKRRGIIVYDHLNRPIFTPFPTENLKQNFQVTYNNRNNWGTLFDAPWDWNGKLDVSEYEQEAGKPNVFMIQGKDSDYYLSTDNITNDNSWQVREVGANVIFFDVIDSSRRQVDQFRFFKVRELD